MLGILPILDRAAVTLAQAAAGTAAGGQQPGTGFKITIPPGLPDPNKGQDIGTIVTNIIIFGLGVSGSLVVLFLIVGGIYYLTAAGDQERLEKAKKTIRNAIIGAVFILLSLVITVTVQSALKGS